MPNVHMQTAANDLQRAVADLKQKEQQIRADTDRNKREISERINELKLEETRLQVQGHNTEDMSVKVTSGVRFTNIKLEIRNLEKKLYDLEEETRKLLQALERQAQHVNDLSKELQTMA